MPWKGKKKVQAVDEDPEIEVIMRVEVIYEDTKAVTGSETEYKWGEIYRMITNRSISDTGLEDLPIYSNIERSMIMQVYTRLKLFPCVELIGWILPKADVTKVILSNMKGHGFVTYSPVYAAQSCKLPTPHTYLIEE